MNTSLNLQFPSHPEDGNPAPLPHQFDPGLVPLRPEHLNYRRSRPGEHFVWDNTRRLLPHDPPFCILQATLEGRGFFRSPQGVVPLIPGRVFLTPVPSPTSYWLPKEGSWSWIFLVVSGEVAHTMVERINIRHGYLFDHESVPFLIPALVDWYDALLDGRLPESTAFSSEIFRLLMDLDAAAGQRGGGGAENLARLVYEAIERNYGDPGFRFADVAARLGLAPYELARAFRGAVGKSPREVLKQRRLSAARNLLVEQGCSIKEIAYRVGYSSPGALCNAFKAATGKSPRDLRRRAWMDDGP
ncbi:MAG: helix-turn-helix domain-containing protein [Puniceicoccaceae bacterium]